MKKELLTYIKNFRIQFKLFYRTVKCVKKLDLESHRLNPENKISDRGQEF